MWVMETYSIAVVGRAGEMEPGPKGNPEKVDTTREVFVQTSGLVDIHSVANKIIFVLPTKTQNQIDIGGSTFGVALTPYRNELPADQVIPVYNMDEQINTMLDRMMASHTSLRSEFSSYTTPYFTSGLDWLDVDALVVSLIVRWHQRIEGTRVVDEAGNYLPERLNSGAPLDVLQEYQMQAIDGITQESYHDFGGSRAVTSMDHRVVTQLRARRYPAMLIGHWTNMAELAVGLEVGVYNLHNVEKEEEVQARLHGGDLDHLLRAQFLRKGFEQFKRAAGLVEIVAFPRQHNQFQRYWPSVIGSLTTQAGTNVAWFAREMVTKMVKWSWNVNDGGPGDGATMTGIRTISAMWRTNTNTEWGNFNLRNARGNGEEGWYMKDGRENVWSSNCWVQIGEGHDDPLLDTGLFRLNLQTQSWGLTNEMHPTFQRLNSYS